MNYSKTFVQYLLKKYNKIILILFGIGFLLFPFPAIFTELSYDNVGSLYKITDTFLYMGTIIACITAFALPIVIRSVFLDRQKCRLYLPLPLSLNRIYFILSVFAYLAFWACFSVLLIIVFLINTIKSLPVDIAYLYYYIGMLVVTLSIFTQTTLISSLANNVIDAIILNISVQLAFLLLISASSIDLSAWQGQILVPVSFVDNLTTLSEENIIYQNTLEANLFTDRATLIAFIAHFVLSVGYFFLSSLVVSKYQSESAGDKTEKWYSYPLINTILFTTVWHYCLFEFSFSQSFTIVFGVIAIALYFIVEFIYQRRVKLTITNVIRLVIFLVAGLILSLIR